MLPHCFNWIDTGDNFWVAKQKNSDLRMAGDHILLGAFSNFSAMALNGGLMPVSPDAFLKVFHYLPYDPGKGYLYSGPDTKLPLLGDWIPVYSLELIVSPGDIIVVSLFLFFIIYLILGNHL